MCLRPVFWIRIRDDPHSFFCPGSGPDPYWECGSGSRSMETDINLQVNLVFTFQKSLSTFVGTYVFYLIISLKGQCHEIFCFCFFSWISFPPAPEYTIKTVSNFFENSRRCSQLKVCLWCRWHRWQMEKIFNQKNFNNFLWSPLGSGGNTYINFCLQVHFQVSAAWYCSHFFATGVNDTGGIFAGVVDTGGNLPPVSTTQGDLVAKFATGINVENLPPVSLIPAAICHRCLWHRWQICHRCRWHRWCTLTCEYLREFSKKFAMILMFGAWGKVIHEKNLKQKITWHCPFKYVFL